MKKVAKAVVTENSITFGVLAAADETILRSLEYRAEGISALRSKRFLTTLVANSWEDVGNERIYLYIFISSSL